MQGLRNVEATDPRHDTLTQVRQHQNKSDVQFSFSTAALNERAASIHPSIHQDPPLNAWQSRYGAATDVWRDAWLPDGYSQIFRSSYDTGPSSF